MPDMHINSKTHCKLIGTISVVESGKMAGGRFSFVKIP